MDQMSVTQFAGELKMPASALLEQLQKAGVDKNNASDLLSEQDKARLLEYLRRAHGESQGKSKITLTRKQTSEIKATDSTGRARTVQVEVRKKRVFVKRDELLADAAQSSDEEVVEQALEDAVTTQSAVVAEPEPQRPVEPEPEEPEVVVAPVVQAPAEPEPEPETVVALEPEAPVVEPEPEAKPAEAAPSPNANSEPASVESAAPKTLADVLGQEELEARRREAERGAALAARQAADKLAKQERELRARAAAEARRADEERKAREAAEEKAKATSGTLHKPAKTEERGAQGCQACTDQDRGYQQASWWAENQDQ